MWHTIHTGHCTKVHSWTIGRYRKDSKPSNNKSPTTGMSHSKQMANQQNWLWLWSKVTPIYLFFGGCVSWIKVKFIKIVIIAFQNSFYEYSEYQQCRGDGLTKYHDNKEITICVTDSKKYPRQTKKLAFLKDKIDWFYNYF